MNLSNFFGPLRLTPQWSFTASHTLWRFLVSDGGLILGEDRDTERKTVSFFCIDMKTGAVRWRDKKFAEAWWIGIEALAGERLYLHGFAQPDMPDHRGLTALDARTGAEVWHHPAISFYAADADRVIGYRDLFERRVFEGFDAATGMLLGEVDDADSPIDEMRRHSFGRTDFIFSQPLSPDDTEQALIQQALARHGAESPVPPIVEFAHACGRLIFNAHIPRVSVPGPHAPILKNILCVLNAVTGKEEFFDTLNAETPYPVPDSFFMDADTLYYVQERQTLCALRLA